MTKVDLVNKIAEKLDYSKKDSEKALNAVLESITDSLAAGEKVALVGFGTFEVKERAERTCKNPRTQEEMIVPACKVPGFKAGKGLKDAVAK
ncbi:HU family DNA-binding protein [Candidatus Soleaferrea massiliensis]|uniref:HU family DNA-binding protein n=1 Tax=Candidatus Soleaferrea massiliensis TaxID=1470354 RepID=UPI00058FAA2E|nr:HU family DNA-binding protein [Candidatus Soleaferrea massiliensis]